MTATLRLTSSAKLNSPCCYDGMRTPVHIDRNIEEKANLALQKTFFLGCIEKGMYFHTDFIISAMHGEEILSHALRAKRMCHREVKKEIT